MTAQYPRAKTPTAWAQAADRLPDGSWTARWGDWVVHLRGISGVWSATVWRWTTGGGYDERTQLGRCEGFASGADATAWACDVLREGGAKVFVVDNPTLRLETVLRFNPAPEVAK